LCWIISTFVAESSISAAISRSSNATSAARRKVSWAVGSDMATSAIPAACHQQKPAFSGDYPSFAGRSRPRPRIAPVGAIRKVAQLRRRDRRRLAHTGRGPDELARLEALHIKAKPAPPCHRIFTRSARRPRTQKSAPPDGSRPSPACTDREAVHPAAHVRHTAPDPDLRACRKRGSRPFRHGKETRKNPSADGRRHHELSPVQQHDLVLSPPSGAAKAAAADVSGRNSTGRKRGNRPPNSPRR